MNRTALTHALIASLCAAKAFANDTTAELKTGGLEFTHSDNIAMQEENLYISPKQVTVDYVYRNTSDKPVDTYVAFPMPDIEGSLDPMMDAGDTSSDNFLGFSVVQDGAPITPSLQQRAFWQNIDVTDVLLDQHVPLNPLSEKTAATLKALPKATLDDLEVRGLVYAQTSGDGADQQTDWVPTWTLKSSYFWKTTFPSGKDVHVSHKYKPSVGGTVAITYLDENNQPKGERHDEYVKKYCVDDTFTKIAQKSQKAMQDQQPYLVEHWISYVLTTGANWSGPIGKFTLIVDKGDPKNFVSFCGTGVKKTGPTTFEVHATDFTPDRDLDILLLTPSDYQ